MSKVGMYYIKVVRQQAAGGRQRAILRKSSGTYHILILSSSAQPMRLKAFLVLFQTKACYLFLKAKKLSFQYMHFIYSKATRSLKSMKAMPQEFVFYSFIMD